MRPLILHVVEDDIATIILNRPEKLNAIDYAMADALLDLLDRLETRDDVRALIVTGSGDRAFSAGADIPQFAASAREGVDVALRDFVRRGQCLTARLEAYTKPVIAAVNGLAFGGGCEITEAVHLAVASERATFAKPEIALGMPPTFGGTQRLARLAGRKKALELLLTADRFDARHALGLGLVNQVVPHDDVVPAARRLALKILRHGSVATAAIITAVTRGLNMGIAEGLQAEGEQFVRAASHPDFEAALDRWLERAAAS